MSVQLITKSGIIEKGKLATLKHEIAKYDEELKLYIVAHREEVNKNPINTSGYENMKKYIPSFKKKYEDKLKISNNKLVYMNDNVSDAERELFNNAGIGSDEMTQIYYLDENNKEQVLEINDAAISETSYTSKSIAKEKITKVIFGSSCKKIEQRAFKECSELKSVTGETTKEIEIAWEAFGLCDKLESIKFINVKFVEKDSQFYGCNNLTNVELGSKENLVESVPDYIVHGSKNPKLLVKIYMEKNEEYTNHLKRNNNATIIQYSANGEENNIVIGQKYKGTNIDWKSLSKFEEIKDISKITEIRSEAFLNCKNLQLESLPENIKVIDDYAFKQCENLAITYIPKECIKIGLNAFEQCNKLETIIGETTNTVEIKGNAFISCKNLASVKFTNVKFAADGNGRFAVCNNLTSLELGSKEHMVEIIPRYIISNSNNSSLVVKIYMERNATYESYLVNRNNSTLIIYNSNGEQIN